MRLRLALTAACAIALVLGAAPATAAGDAADLTLVVTSAGTPQTWSAGGVRFGAGPELVGSASGACDVGGLVDIDPATRTIAVTVARVAASADVSLTILSGAIGGLTVVTPGLSGVTLTATPEIAIITFASPPATGSVCTTTTAVFGYVAPGEALPVVERPLAPAWQVAPAASDAPDAAAAAVVVADPTFAG